MRWLLAFYLSLIGPVLHAAEWLTDYAPALAESARQERPLFILFESDHCLWCQRQERELSQVDLSGCVLLKVRAEQSSLLVPHFGVNCYPTIVVAAHDGTVRDHLIGFKHAETVREAVRRGWKK